MKQRYKIFMRLDRTYSSIVDAVDPVDAEKQVVAQMLAEGAISDEREIEAIGYQILGYRDEFPEEV